MRVLVFGAGAIGTYIGGSLSLSGSEVVFLEKPEIAQTIHNQGMQLDIDGNQFIIHHPNICNSLEQALASRDYEIAILAVKSNDTQALLQTLTLYQSRIPPILCLQNGVENEQTLASKLGNDRVIAGTVTSAVGRRAAGNIILEKKRGIGIANSLPISKLIIHEFNQAGLNAHLFQKSMDLKWSKMMTNLLANATSAILNMRPAEIFNHSGLYKLEVMQLRETLSVMKALGIRAVNLPKVPVKMLAFGIRYIPQNLTRPLLRRAIGGGRGGKMPSFHIDLYSGRGTSEVDYLNGAVVRFGERLGIPTPVNGSLNQILLSLVNKRLPLNTYDHKPRELVDAILHPG